MRQWCTIDDDDGPRFVGGDRFGASETRTGVGDDEDEDDSRDDGNTSEW